jgi:hypothetical protein
MRIDGILCRVLVEQRENNELTEIYYRFQFFADGKWPVAWQTAGIPAPEFSAIVGAFDEKSWNNREDWYGSFRANMRFLGFNSREYADTLRRAGFITAEYPSGAWELEKEIRLDGVRYRVSVTDIENEEIPEIRYQFAEVSE